MGARGSDGLLSGQAGRVSAEAIFSKLRVSPMDFDGTHFMEQRPHPQADPSLPLDPAEMTLGHALNLHRGARVDQQDLRLTLTVWKRPCVTGLPDLGIFVRHRANVVQACPRLFLLTLMT